MNTSTPFLSGANVILRPLEPKADAAHVARWINDPIVTHLMFYGQLPVSEEATLGFLEKMTEPGNVHIPFMVLDKKSHTPVGFAGFYEIDWISRRAEFRILLGETSFWGKGYGTEVAELLTWFGFDRLNLYRLDLGVTADNSAARRVYEKAGYEQECVRKDFMYRNGRYYDAVFMVLFRDRYLKKYAETYSARFTQKPTKK